MLSSALKDGGRGYAIAVWSVGMMTIVALACLWLISEADALARIISTFMLGVGGIGTAYQGQNIAKALPGARPETERRPDA